MKELRVCVRRIEGIEFVTSPRQHERETRSLPPEWSASRMKHYDRKRSCETLEHNAPGV